MAKAVALTLLLVAAAGAQQPTAAPTNDAPNPYQTIAGFAKMPDARTWGSTSGVGIDKDGTSIWVAERCGANTCVGSTLPSVLHFDASGNLMKAFGEGLIQVPHGLFVDRDGNIWVTDWANGRPPQRDTTKGHQVWKFSPDGKVLMTLGTAGGARDPGYFFQPNAVLVAPNGNIFVAEGHTDAETATARILKFDKSGKFLASYGKRGSGDGEFIQPHALAMDSRGRLFVGDRSNNRIVILDQDFKPLGVWTQFSRPSGIYIDKNDVIYVADSESGSVNPGHKDWKRGIRVGNAKDGSVTAFIPDPDSTVTGTSSAEGIAVDSKGVIYGAEVGQKAIKRYVKKP